MKIRFTPKPCFFLLLNLIMQGFVVFFTIHILSNLTCHHMSLKISKHHSFHLLVEDDIEMEMSNFSDKSKIPKKSHNFLKSSKIQEFSRPETSELAFSKLELLGLVGSSKSGYHTTGSSKVSKTLTPCQAYCFSHFIVGMTFDFYLSKPKLCAL